MTADRLRYRLATALWPDHLLERDPRVEEMVRVAYWAGQVSRGSAPRFPAAGDPADPRGRSADRRAR